MRYLRTMAVAAMFFCLGLVLPFATGQIKVIGAMLLPMHLPVMLCGLICGWQYGAVVGFLLPLIRSLLFGMPILFPSAVAMAFELGTYGLVIGLVYLLFKRRTVAATYASLVSAMIAGRIVWGVAQRILLGFLEKDFPLSAFFGVAFVSALPGIVLQLVLVPSIAMVVQHAVGNIRKE